MLFAKLDVCVWRHERFIAAGPAAAGYWMAALARLREDSSSDGYISPTVAGMLLKVGDREARKFSKRLVDVGLFEAKGEGHTLLGYALKNETKEEIEARRLDTRARVTLHRSSKRGNGLHRPEGNAAVTRYKGSVTSTVVPGSDSGSLSSPDLQDRRSPPATPPQDLHGARDPNAKPAGILDSSNRERETPSETRLRPLPGSLGPDGIERERADQLLRLAALETDPSFGGAAK